MCAVDSAITVFRVISRYACCVVGGILLLMLFCVCSTPVLTVIVFFQPKLCQIAVPFVLAIDDSSAETAVQLVLRYASVIASSGTICS